MRTIDISGPGGNAFALMGYARILAIQMGLDSNAIVNDMMSGDYEHLLEVFENHFGHLAKLER